MNYELEDPRLTLAKLDVAYAKGNCAVVLHEPAKKSAELVKAHPRIAGLAFSSSFALALFLLPPDGHAQGPIKACIDAFDHYRMLSADPHAKILAEQARQCIVEHDQQVKIAAEKSSVDFAMGGLGAVFLVIVAGCARDARSQIIKLLDRE